MLLAVHHKSCDVALALLCHYDRNDFVGGEWRGRSRKNENHASKYNFIARAARKTKSEAKTTYGLNDTETYDVVHIHPLGIIIDSLLIYIIVW
jgi:hypothetical protein